VHYQAKFKVPETDMLPNFLIKQGNEKASSIVKLRQKGLGAETHPS
jgi:hypothetical protein